MAELRLEPRKAGPQICALKHKEEEVSHQMKVPTPCPSWQVNPFLMVSRRSQQCVVYCFVVSLGPLPHLLERTYLPILPIGKGGMSEDVGGQTYP